MLEGRTRQSYLVELALAVGCEAVDVLWRAGYQCGFKHMIANVSP